MSPHVQLLSTRREGSLHAQDAAVPTSVAGDNDDSSQLSGGKMVPTATLHAASSLCGLCHDFSQMLQLK